MIQLCKTRSILYTIQNDGTKACALECIQLSRGPCTLYEDGKIILFANYAPALRKGGWLVQDPSTNKVKVLSNSAFKNEYRIVKEDE